MLKIEDKKRFAIFAVGVLLLAGAAVFLIARGLNKNKGLDKVSLEQAAKMGEMATHKLMIQIENPKGKAEDASGRYERGDIILIMPSDHQFSAAEKEGTLIIKMDLTEKQAEVMVQSLSKETNQKDERDRPQEETLKRRKFAADLAKIGISEGDEKGREIENKIFGWDIVYEKK